MRQPNLHQQNATFIGDKMRLKFNASTVDVAFILQRLF